MLPDIIDPSEELARVICGGSKRKTHRKFFDADPDRPGKYIVNTGTFIDSRTPMELSVNRISTLTEEQSHQLGLKHREERRILASYNGYAKTRAIKCFEKNCQVVKEDYNGTKPYHANIIYPQGEKQDYQEIAIYLTFHSEFVPYKSL